MLECNYWRDSLDGAYRSFYRDGKKQEVSFFKMGKVDGTYQYYHENGQLWIEKEYRDGLLLNVKFNYDEYGKPRDFGTLRDGNGTVKYYTTSGDVYNIQLYKDGVMISESSKGDFE